MVSLETLLPNPKMHVMKTIPNNLQGDGSVVDPGFQLFLGDGRLKKSNRLNAAFSPMQVWACPLMMHVACSSFVCFWIFGFIFLGLTLIQCLSWTLHLSWPEFLSFWGMSTILNFDLSNPFLHFMSNIFNFLQSTYHPNGRSIALNKEGEITIQK